MGSEHSGVPDPGRYRVRDARLLDCPNALSQDPCVPGCDRLDMTSNPFPEPFDREESNNQAPGCGRPALIGCGLLLLLLLIGSVLFLLKAGDLFRWALGKMEQQVMMSLPEDLDAATRLRLEVAFDAAGDAVVDGSADPQALQELQTRFYRISQSAAKGLSKTDVYELIEVLEGVAGIAETGRPPSATEVRLEVLFLRQSPPRNA